MPLLLINHDLITPGQDYAPFEEAIKSNSTAWWHQLNNTWIVNTHLNEQTFAQVLYRHMTQSDRLFIIEIKGIGQGWLPKDAWEWLEEQNKPFHAMNALLLSNFGLPPKSK